MNSFFRQAGVCTGYSWKFHRDWGSFYFVFKKWEFQGPGSTSRRYAIFSGATQKAGVAILPVTQNTSNHAFGQYQSTNKSFSAMGWRS